MGFLTDWEELQGPKRVLTLIGNLKDLCLGLSLVFFKGLSLLGQVVDDGGNDFGGSFGT